MVPGSKKNPAGSGEINIIPLIELRIIKIKSNEAIMKRQNKWDSNGSALIDFYFFFIKSFPISRPTPRSYNHPLPRIVTLNLFQGPSIHVAYIQLL